MSWDGEILYKNIIILLKRLIQFTMPLFVHLCKKSTLFVRRRGEFVPSTVQ